MYDPKLISPEILSWVLGQAENELNAYLCEVDFRTMYGAEWPKLARDIASRCHAVAATSTDAANRQSWLDLARNYEGTIA